MCYYPVIRCVTPVPSYRSFFRFLPRSLRFRLFFFFLINSIFPFLAQKCDARPARGGSSCLHYYYISLSHHKQRPRRPTLHSHRTSPLSTPYISSPRAFSALSNKKHTTLHPTLHPEPQSCTRTRTRTQPNRPPRTRAPQD